jgi:hypothetical protein
MKPLTNVFLLVFCLSMALAQEVNEDRVDPLTNYVFDLPDIVANYEILGEEVQLEAFGSRQVNLIIVTMFLKPGVTTNICVAKILHCVT